MFRLEDSEEPMSEDLQSLHNKRNYRRHFLLENLTEVQVNFRLGVILDELRAMRAETKRVLYVRYAVSDNVLGIAPSRDTSVHLPPDRRDALI